MRVALKSTTKTFRFLEEFRATVVKQVALREQLYQITRRTLRLRYKQTAMGFVSPLLDTLSRRIGRLTWNFTASAPRFAERV